MRVFLSAGEASGDAYGAGIVGALDARGAFSHRALAADLIRELAPESPSDGVPHSVVRDIARTYGGSQVGTLEDREVSAERLAQAIELDLEEGSIEARRLRLESLSAIGSGRLAAAGVGILADSSHWGAVGIAESLSVVPRVYEGYHHAKGLLKTVAGGLFIPIDFGYINVKLARVAKKNGWRVLYFSPPGAWRRDKQGKDIPKVSDAVVTPFPWSAETLRSMGADAHFFGHPLKQMVGPVSAEAARDGVAVLPGSRWHEVKNNVWVIAAALRQLQAPARFAVAANLDTGHVQALWEAAGGGEAEFRRDTYEVLKESRAAVVCSGTATLEAALCRTPTVVVYRGSKLMELEYRLRRPGFDFVSLPNILLERRVLPELIQWDASSERIASELEPLLQDSKEAREQLAAFEEVSEMLGPADCIDRTADLALKLAGQA